MRASDSSPFLPAETLAAVPATWVERGSPTYLRISLALFLVGFATFSLIYCVQPLLPTFAATFGVSPAQSSLALSLNTGCLAVAILASGVLSEAVGRRGLMCVSMAAASLLNMAAAAIPSWHGLLAVRALEGLVLGGVPAVAMAYLAEEIHPRGLGLAMGLYVGGTAFGGMMGRVGMGLLTEFGSWRTAMAVMGLVDLLAAGGFLALLPASRHFVRRPGFNPVYHGRAWSGHLRHRQLPWLFFIGFLALGAIVATYNYVGFRLTAPPYRLSESQAGFIFTVYLFGMVASSGAGALADRLGRGPVLISGLLLMGLGAVVTLSGSLAVIIGGIAILTAGFFAAHSIASGWVGGLAQSTKGHAASLYLLAYYLGSSFLGSAGGWFWGRGGWPGLVAFTSGLIALAIGATVAVMRSAQAR